MIGRRLRWMAVGGAVTLVAKARVRHAVDAEARRLPDLVPAASPLLARLPPDAARAAGAAVVAGRTALVGGRVGYRAAVLGGRGAISAGTAAALAGRVVARGGSAAHDAVLRARMEVDEARSAWQAAAAAEERLLRAELARLDGDETAAIDALVDRRSVPPSPDQLPALPPPVPPGRVRAATPLASGGGRPQRSYRQPARPWSGPDR